MFSPKEFLHLTFTSFVSLTPLSIWESSTAAPSYLVSFIPSHTVAFPVSLLSPSTTPMSTPTIELSPLSSPNPHALSLVNVSSPPNVSLCDRDTRPPLSVFVSLPSPVPIPKSSGVPTPSVYPMQTQSKLGIIKPKHILSLSTSLIEVEPTIIKQASQYAKWRQAMYEEYNVLIANYTWDLVPSQP